MLQVMAELVCLLVLANHQLHLVVAGQVAQVLLLVLARSFYNLPDIAVSRRSLFSLWFP